MSSCGIVPTVVFDYVRKKAVEQAVKKSRNPGVWVYLSDVLSDVLNELSVPSMRPFFIVHIHSKC
ncbi:hypothetical protein BDP27DRAFT_1420712 [Rhodocollybia butyracea]|uniref:Uncharacterized protein n=1 Tax=Rhodocollybia butyracea TaxID=206335 RepID=A0A9P5PWH5_9AGAR|nr:hypothetical protein BDP27DRAFT_1420712 [Rhodocollybia butyracea]